MKSVVAIALLAFLTYGCGKSNDTCTDVSPETEESAITAFCLSNGITAQKDESGMYYEIINPGTTPVPDLTDSVYVLYTGTFLNGTVFDGTETTPLKYIVNGFIDGWKIGLTKIAKGGQIKLVIPSYLAYGCYGSPPTIPPNAVLYFDIRLVDVKPMP